MRTAEPRMTSTQAWVLTLASVGSFMVALDALVVATALSTIRRDLGASIEQLEWTVNAYNLTFGVLLLTGAALGDRFGRRRVFVAGLAIFAAASAACALSPGIGWLIAARGVQGAGAALVTPMALTLLSAAFPPESRGRALGIFGGLTRLATLSGPFIGGAIAQGLAWQWIFWVNVPIALIAILLVFGRVADSAGPDRRIDFPGLALVTGGALGLVWGLVRGNNAGWGSLEVIGSLAAGALLVVAFVAWEMRTRAPMLPVRLFRLRAFSAANAANLCGAASLVGSLFLLSQFLQTAQGYGPLGAGLRMMPLTATLFVCAPIAGLLADRIGERPLIASGLLLQTIGMGWLAAIASPNLAYPAMVVPLIVGGCGLSMVIPSAQRSVVGAVDPTEIGMASGALNMLRILGWVFGVAILTAVFAATGSLASPQAFTQGFAPAIGVAAGLGLVGAIAALWIPRRRRPTEVIADVAEAA